MKEFIEKLIGRLEEYKYSHLIERDSGQTEHCLGQEDCEMMDCTLCVWDKAIEIVNQLAEEHYKSIADWANEQTVDVSELLHSEYQPKGE